MKKLFYKILLFTISSVILLSCATQKEFRKVYTDYRYFKSTMDSARFKPYLKAHLKNGDAAIFFSKWEIDSASGEIKGKGCYYDYTRDPVDTIMLAIDPTDVALFETNSTLVNNEQAIGASLGVLATADVVLGIICLTVPKACFGSCPTFYLNDTINIHYADAEGFSSSVLSVLKASDIDALNNGRIEDREVTITMKNEALETHVVDKVALYAIPRNGRPVFHGPDDNFYKGNSIIKINSTDNLHENQMLKLLDQDKDEWFSKSDQDNLTTKEEVILTFKGGELADSKNLGLSLTFRQSLMTTYLYYNMMDYLGEMRPYLMANIESGRISPDIVNKVYEALGGIEAYVQTGSNGEWEYIGSYNEAGPIAFNKQLLPLINQAESDKLRIKLKMTQGLWRIDNAELVTDIETVMPIKLLPVWVKNKEELDNNVLKILTSDDQSLSTYPGDSYQIGFELPVDGDFELFLFSVGYYLEWLRPEWLETNNLRKLSLLLYKPERYLKKESRSYKLYEDQMDEIFWNSKIK